MDDIDDELFDGLPVDNDVLIKATLLVPAHPMKSAVLQSLSVDLVEKYKARSAALLADVRAILNETTVQKSELRLVAVNGSLLMKAANPNAAQKPQTVKAPPKTVTPTGERKLTASGYVHVEHAGSRGGKFWRDDKGNVRYGERPHGKFNTPASPAHVVDHFRQYYAPQPFSSHDQMDLREALSESSVLSEADHAFMSWWNESYDEVIGSLGITRKDVERAGGLHNISVKVGGRTLGFGEAMEEFFKANADLFVGDPDYGDVESPEDIAEAVRGLMERYRTALHEDPKVQAAAQASAEKREIEKNAFYIQAEQMAEEFSPLASDMITLEDPNDLATRFTAAMSQMGLIKRGGKGGVANRRMRGAIVPASDLLMTRKRDLGTLWQHGQLDRLNAPQLMALHIAVDAQNSLYDDNTYEYDPGAKNAMREQVFDQIADKLGISDDKSARLALQRKLEKTTEATLQAFNAHNTGQDPHFADVLKMKVKDVAGDNDAMKEHLDKVADEKARLEEILAAQEDDSFEPPPSMANGVWNGKTLKDKNNPEKGVWEPFRYQKKYINWMKKVKRGVIAADAGMGKALPYTEPVLTAAGFKAIGSIAVGDYVIGKNGEETRVIGVFAQGERKCFRIEFSDGTFSNCDENHVWTLKVGSGFRANWQDKTTRQIIEEGWENEDGRKKFALPLVDAVRFKPRGELRVDPYHLGLLLGDGMLSKGEVSFFNTEPDLLKEMSEAYGALVDNAPTCPRVRFSRVCGEAGDLYTALAKHNLLGTNSTSKFIPEAYKFASPEVRLEVLRGLLDTDGSVLGGTVLDYCSVSKQLAKDVAFIARSLGAIVRMSSRHTYYEHKGERLRGAQSWRLQMRFLNGTVPVKCARKVAQYIPNDVNPKDKRIVDVIAIEDQETVCIKVAAADGLFVTRDFTVTHNTPTVIAFRESLAAQGKDVPAICFLPPSLMEQWPGQVAKFAPEHKDNILNLSGLSLAERKEALQSDMAKKAKYIFISTGTLTGDVPDPNATEDENDGTGGSDHEMVKILQGLEGAVFIDEAHQGGYKRAGNTRHEIAKAVMQDREYAFGMTATPMPNDPMDLYHLANLFAPGSVGDQELWSGRMAGVAWNEEKGSYDVSNPEHIADLNKRLKPFVFYKSINDPDVVEDMGKGLTERKGVHESEEMWPDEGDLAISEHVNSENGLSQHHYFKEGGVIDTMVKLRIDRLVRDREERIRNGEEGLDSYNEGMLSLMAGGMKVMLQRQASISPALIDPTYRRADGGVAHTPKMKALCDDIVTHFSNGGQGGDDAKPLVVFCSFPQKAYPLVRKALAERGVDPSLIETIAGDVAPAERGYMQDKLNKGHSKVLLVGTMSGGAGLNLQEAANKTLFLDEPWNPAAKRQAIGRVWRTGQNNPVHEKTYRTVGTYDSVLEQKLAGKQAMVGALLGKQMPTEQTFSTDTSIKELLGRVQGDSSFSEGQIKAIMENAKHYDLSASPHKDAEKFLDENWKQIAGDGGRGGAGASFTDADFKPNKAAQEDLKKKGAHSLTKEFDEKEFRGQWELDRDTRRSKQSHQMAQLMEKVHRDKGNDEEADQYKKKHEALAEKYPALKGTSGSKPGDKKKDAGKDTKGASKPGSTSSAKGKQAGGEDQKAAKQAKPTSAVAVPEPSKQSLTQTSKPDDENYDPFASPEEIKRLVGKTKGMSNALSSTDYQKMQDDLKASMSHEENAAVLTYTDSMAYADINEALRAAPPGAPVKIEKYPELEKTVEHLDNVIARSKLPHNVKLYRGVGGRSSGAYFAAMKPGEEFIDNAFVSTSSDPKYVKSAYNIKMVIHAPGGTNAIPVHAGRDTAHEVEMLLKRGTKFRVKSNTVSEIENGMHDPRNPNSKPTKQQRVMELEIVPDKAPAKGEMSQPSKTLASNPGLGLNYHTKENPFNASSNRKVKGSDVPHAEASAILDMLKKTKSKSMSDFMNKDLKEVWDDEDGRNPFTSDAAETYLNKMIDVFKKQGVLTHSPQMAVESKKQPPAEVKPPEKAKPAAQKPVVKTPPKTEGKPTASAAPPDNKSLGKMIQDAADAAPAEHGAGSDEKVFISHIYDSLKSKLGGMSLEDFKQKLPELQQQGHVMMSRADLPSRFLPDDMKGSETYLDHQKTSSVAAHFIHRKKFLSGEQTSAARKKYDAHLSEHKAKKGAGK